MTIDPPPRADHRTRRRLCREEIGALVDRLGVVVGLLGDVDERTRREDCGVVHENRDRPEFVLGALDDGVDRCHLAQVTNQVDRFAIAVFDECHRFRCGLGGDIHHRYRMSVGRQPEGDGSAQFTAGAGYHRAHVGSAMCRSWSIIADILTGKRRRNATRFELRG